MSDNSQAIEDREYFVRRGWLRDNESPLLPRLAYPFVTPTPYITDENRLARARLLEEMAVGMAQPSSLPCCLGGTDDLVVAEVERYCVPLRTVVDRVTGLVRSDPYFDESYLARFYGEIYRPLHEITYVVTSGKPNSPSRYAQKQIATGEVIYDLVKEMIPAHASVADIGCGMGGCLIPFKLAGHRTIGCDYGPDHLSNGRRLGLDLREGGCGTIAGDGPFDLVILSHVLEHQIKPIAFLREVRELVAPGGKLVVLVPGLFNIRRAYRGNLQVYFQIPHCWHFNAATLTAVLARAGLRVIQCDEVINCVATPSEVVEDATATSGNAVISEIQAIEADYQTRNALASGHRYSARVRRLMKSMVNRILPPAVQAGAALTGGPPGRRT